MENAVWNGKEIMATEISKEYAIEKEIRKASGRKELRCPDSDCKNPTLKYCHGEKKEAYFSHINNEHCDYALFDKENNQAMRNIRHLLYEHFISKGFDVKPEVKVFKKHYAHLLFNFDNKAVALEIGTQQTSANKLDRIMQEYESMDMSVIWIVADNAQTFIKENETFFIKRYALNETDTRDLIIISWNGENIAQHRLDTNRYYHNDHEIVSENYPPIFSEYSSLGELTISNGRLSLEGFGGRYDVWLDKKQKAFRKKIIALNEEQKAEEIRIKELNERLKRGQADLASIMPTRAIPQAQPKISKEELLATYEERKKEILLIIDQADIPARDSNNQRWVKCKLCGLVDTEEHFSSYGGKGLEANRGTCRKCSGFRNT